MRRRKGERCFNVVQGLAQRLAGQAVHQVEIEVVEVRGGDLDRAPCFVAIVDAAERFQMRRVEALDAEREPVDAGGAEGGELVGFHCAGVGFERDLRLGQERQAHADRRQQLVERFAGKQARRATAEEDARYLASPDQRQRRLKIGDQRRDVLGLGNAAACLVRVEVTVGAFLHAPGNVHVQGERQRVAKLQAVAGRDRHPALQQDRDDAARGIAFAHPMRALSRSIRCCRARPRCERRFFSAESSSAAVTPRSGSRKYGS